MSLDRDSQDYQLKKLAWELCHSPQWVDYLKPLLEKKASFSPKKTTSFDELIQLGNELAERSFAKYLIAHIEGVSERFEHLRVNNQH